MQLLGKILGGAAGFALGGPIGAIAGAVAGHAVDHVRTSRSAADPDLTRQGAFTIAVIALGAKLARADGSVTPVEVDTFKRLFRVPPEEARHFDRVFNLARRDVAGYEPYARQVAHLFADNPAVLEELLHALCQVAAAERIAHAGEIDYLRSVATIFAIEPETFERIRETHFGREGMDPFAVLGIARDADDAAVRDAWLRLIRANHPDSLIAQGVPREFVALATERMATINAAYDQIRTMRAAT